MGIRIVVETDADARSRRIKHAIDRVTLALNDSVTKLDPAARLTVYAAIMTRLEGRISSKIRRKTQNVYHKGARH